MALRFDTSQGGSEENTACTSLCVRVCAHVCGGGRGRGECVREQSNVHRSQGTVQRSHELALLLCEHVQG